MRVLLRKSPGDENKPRSKRVYSVVTCHLLVYSPSPRSLHVLLSSPIPSPCTCCSIVHWFIRWCIEQINLVSRLTLADVYWSSGGKLHCKTSDVREQYSHGNSPLRRSFVRSACGAVSTTLQLCQMLTLNIYSALADAWRTEVTNHAVSI